MGSLAVDSIENPAEAVQAPVVVFWFVFSTGLVRLYIVGLPLRSCPDHWASF